MKTKTISCLILAILLVLIVNSQPSFPISFPAKFIFGTATSAYQIEGGYQQDGRGMSIWDTFAHTPGKILNGDTGDVADDHYNKLEQDVLLLKYLGVKHYRLSLSWSRILPNGTLEYVNQKGIDHYNEEFNLLIKHGITPYVTLYHWDLPQALHDRFGGWLDKTQIVPAFRDYADLCFKLFGDRVKFWITLNEPWVISVLGYGSGVNAPGRCTGCDAGGDSSTEPYLVSHSLLLAHAEAVNIYRVRYQREQKGVIGIALNSDFYMPQDPTNTDHQTAAEHLQQFLLGWYADPIFKTGDYPAVMRKNVGSRLPTFTAEDKKLLLDSADFLGINHYTSRYVVPSAPPAQGNENWWTDSCTNATIFDLHGAIIGPRAQSEWLYVYPPGIRKLMNWIKSRYNNPSIYITENGVDAPNECCVPRETALNDTFRVNYLHDYLVELGKSIVEDHVNVRGYMVWSLMDNFEWAVGYSSRFGIHYVDYKDANLTRYQKRSSLWFETFITDQEARGGSHGEWVAYVIVILAVAVIGGLIAAFLLTVVIKLAKKRSYEEMSH